MKILSSNFYNRTPLDVAPDLLGKILIRKIGNNIVSGRIVETEAYLGFIDEAAHAFIGQTKRNNSLFKDAGHAYVHTIHNKNCLDVVTEKIGVPTSVLIRALEPLVGIDIMRKFRNKAYLKDLTSGPGKLTQALNITRDFDGINITNEKSSLYIVDDNFQYPDIAMVQDKRIGISKAKDKELRFYIKDNPYISKM